MRFDLPFVDIHCHLVPGIDDGAKTPEDSLAMARMAVEDGIRTVITTPHQLGSYRANDGAKIRQRVTELQQLLDSNQIDLRVMPGADVRIEADMIPGLKAGSVLTLGDLGRHVLLELPHEMYIPLEPVLDGLEAAGMVGILSHPERNQGLLRQPNLIPPLVERGCLMQVTAGSIVGTFGPGPQEMAEAMVQEGSVHFVATDAHGPKSRRPLIRRALEQVAELADEQTAIDVGCRNPAAVAEGREVEIRPVEIKRKKKSSWFSWAKSA